MPGLKFTEKLNAVIDDNRSLVCVGLDPEPTSLPVNVSLLKFCSDIIDATSKSVCAYKLNLAFFEAAGDDGMNVLKKVVQRVPENVAVIGDGKRGDIGNTAKAYARSLFDNFGFDAVTVSPYMGHDSLEPFIEYRDKGIFVLCRTSNPGGSDFQNVICQINGGTMPLYQLVAQKVSTWNKYGNLGLVVGATYPEELKTIRTQHTEMPILIPGVGAQGGELSLVLKYGTDRVGRGAIINSSRQIIYASKGADFAEAAGKAAAKLRDEINNLKAASK